MSLYIVPQESIYEKALFDALFLILGNLAVPKTVIENKATMTSMLCYIFDSRRLYMFMRGLRRCSFLIT